VVCIERISSPSWKEAFQAPECAQQTQKAGSCTAASGFLNRVDLVEDAIDLVAQLAFGDEADALIHDLSVLEEQQVGDGLHAILGGNFGALVDIDFEELGFAIVIRRDALENWRQHFAGRTPGSGKIYYNGTAGAFNFRGEIFGSKKSYF
jgi:hypothetical protein